MNVKVILLHVAILSSLGTRVFTRLFFEPGKLDYCEISGGSLCLAEQGHVSLAGISCFCCVQALQCFNSEPGQFVCCLVGCGSPPKCK